MKDKAKQRYRLDPVASGKKLRELRGRKSQQEVADAIGITQSSLHMYETGERTPRDPVKVNIAHYYNVGIEELFFIN